MIGLRLFVSAEGIFGHGARHIEQDEIRIDGESGVGGAEAFAGAARQAEIWAFTKYARTLSGARAIARSACPSTLAS